MATVLRGAIHWPHPPTHQPVVPLPLAAHAQPVLASSRSIQLRCRHQLLVPLSDVCFECECCLSNVRHACVYSPPLSSVTRTLPRPFARTHVGAPMWGPPASGLSPQSNGRKQVNGAGSAKPGHRGSSIRGTSGASGLCSRSRPTVNVCAVINLILSNICGRRPRGRASTPHRRST